MAVTVSVAVAIAGDYVAYAVDDEAGAIGELRDILPGGDARKDENGVETALDARYDVRLHIVADHGRLVAVGVHHVQGGAHHQGVGLAYVVGLAARCDLDGGAEGAAGGGDALLLGVGEVGVGGDEFGTVLHQAHGLADVVPVVGESLAHHYVVGIYVVVGEPLVVEGVEKPRLADGVDAATGQLVREEFGGGQRAGVEVILAYVQPHAQQFHVQFLGGFAAAVGEEQKLLAFVLHPADELFDAGQQFVAVVDDAVHIAYKVFAVA